MTMHRIVRGVLAMLVLVAFVLQGTMVLAGTTGTVSGIVEDASTKTPIAGVKVTAASPSQVATATTDASGRFTFLSLAPDTYVISAEKGGFDTATLQGVTVAADTNQTLTVDASRTLREIGRTTSRAPSSLVKPGTTADVYSITPAQQQAASSFGGGGTQNSAFSALATVPGVFVQPNQSGYIGAGQTISIRGGDYNQIGYEIDGIPVNRAYDSYPSGPSSSLGQQELQVYTGAAPANAEAQGLSGFINQVIQTGTYPGTQSLDLAIGGPSFYNKAALEVSGATQNRNFTYYVGIGGYNQQYRFGDQFNGTGLANPYGQAQGPCPGAAAGGPAVQPSCYVNGNYAANGFVTSYYGLYNFDKVYDRDNVVNLHWLFPRANGLKDDLQVLGMSNWIRSWFADSQNDTGGAAFTANVLGTTGPAGETWLDGRTYTGQLLAPLGANPAANLSNYYFPFSPPHAFGALVPPNQEGIEDNQQALYKIGFTHPFTENLLAKIYAYSYYGYWSEWDPNTYYQNYFGLPGNYDVQNHTTGVSGSLIGQFGAHTVTLAGSFTNTNTSRFNDATEGNGSTIIADRVDSAQAANLAAGGAFNGLCYTATGAAASCFSTAGGGVSINNIVAGSQVTGAGCPSGACTLIATDTGYKGSFNDAEPRNQAFSLTDQWQVNQKLTINGGLRLDNYGFILPSTAYGPARSFWYAAYNQDYCTNAAGFFVAKPAGSITMSCASLGMTTTTVTNPTGAQTAGWLIWQPRIGATFRLDRDSVLRASYGRYSQAPNDAFEQYDAAEANAPARLYNSDGFQIYGFNTPDHPILPQTSDNFDVSWEHQFAGSDTAIKLSPFLRKTQNQIQQFYLNQQTSFVSGLNVGNQTAQGIEFEIDKGDFVRNGLSAKFSFAYTNSYIRYSTLPNGASLLSGINAGILQYNAYTKACAPGGSSFGKTLCGGATTSGDAAAPCYTAAGAADNACLAGSIANPYWNAPLQNILNVNGNYPAYDIPPAATVGSGLYYGYGAPYTATILLQYKHDKFAVRPALQFYAGQKYGAPITTPGVAPDTCTGALAGTTAGDPRYPGLQAGSPYDATTCNTLAGATGFGGIPNPYTGQFDSIGAFTAPANVQLHLQLSYDVSPKATLTVTLANLWNSCFGGTKAAWNVQGACGYTALANGGGAPIGNAYNPGTVISPYVMFPYVPSFGGLPAVPNLPFSIYADLHIKT